MTVTMPDADLASILAEAVATAVREALASPPLPRVSYTPAEVAIMTGLNERWIADLASAEQIASCKFGHYRRLTLPQVMAMVEAYEVLPSSGEKRKALLDALAAAKTALAA